MRDKGTDDRCNRNEDEWNQAVIAIVSAVLQERCRLESTLEEVRRMGRWTEAGWQSIYRTARWWVRYANRVEAVAQEFFSLSRPSWEDRLFVCRVLFPTSNRKDRPEDETVRAIDRRLRQVRPLREGLPDWLDALGEAAYGARWERLLASLNNEAPLFVRVNRLKADLEEVAAGLRSYGAVVRPVEGYPDALQVESPLGIPSLPVYQNGLLEIQDVSSQAVAPFLEIMPGQRILDACAGEGGKTLHLAVLLKNKGKIVATDASERRLGRLRLRARRAGVDTLEVRAELWQQPPDRFRGKYDRVLLDVPCSGSGSWRRHPALKWQIEETALERLRATQMQLLERYASALRANGKLVYSTCSLWPAENRQLVDAFLHRQPHFRLEAEQVFTPDTHPGDGFYMARLQRSAGF